MGGLQVNSFALSKKDVEPMPRSELGIADGAIILAHFNNQYKIDPVVFKAHTHPHMCTRVCTHMHA